MARTKGAKDTQKRKNRTVKSEKEIASRIQTSPKKILQNEKKEEISRIVGESIQYFPRKTAITNAEIADRLNAYFKQCYEEGQIPTVEDMALALGTNRRTLYKWEINVTHNRERAEMIQQAKEVLAAIDAKLVSEGKIPQVTYIFRAKNYFGMRDQQEVVMTPNLDPSEGIDEERLRRKYLDAAYDSSEEIRIEKVPETVEELPDGGEA